MKLAKHNKVQLIWVLDHKGIEGNETADQPPNLGSECPPIGPKQACGISAGSFKKAVWEWANRESLTGLKQAKGFLQGPSVESTKELLKLNGNQLWWVTGPFTDNCHLKGHLFKMGLTNSPICERCLVKDVRESAQHPV
jgi:hypothetical protein